MTHRRFAFPSISAALLLLAATTFAQTAAKHFTGDAWWAHVQFLADDNLEGRQTMAQLVRIVGELQREELRMARLGMIKMA